MLNLKDSHRSRVAGLLSLPARLCIVCLVVASGRNLPGDEPSFPPLPTQADNAQEPAASPEPLPEFSIPMSAPAVVTSVAPNWGGTPDNLEALAIDISRRTVLAFDPKAGKNFIQTRDVTVGVQGHLVHLSATLVAETKKGVLSFHRVPTTWQVSATLIYSPGLRRLIDLNVRQDGLVPYRDCPRLPQLLTAYNEQFDRLDPLRMPVPLVGDDPEFLAPRSKQWLRAPLQGDPAWHVFHADRFVEQPED